MVPRDGLAQLAGRNTRRACEPSKGVCDVRSPRAARQAQASVKCVGGNSCKGQSECASANNSCKGQNSCKGKGYVSTASAQDCQQKGGKVEKN